MAPIESSSACSAAEFTLRVFFERHAPGKPGG
jgi:hypothetical protein